jgi:hypothetical protein
MLRGSASLLRRYAVPPPRRLPPASPALSLVSLRRFLLQAVPHRPPPPRTWAPLSNSRTSSTHDAYGWAMHAATQTSWVISACDLTGHYDDVRNVFEAMTETLRAELNSSALRHVVVAHARTKMSRW